MASIGFPRSEIVTAIWRFPLPVLCAVAVTLICWPVIAPEPDPASGVPLTLVLAAAFFWSWAAALFGESVRRPLAAVAVLLAGLLVIAFAFELLRSLAVWLHWQPRDSWTNIGVQQAFLLGFIAVAPTLAAYIAGRRSQPAYWQFNHKWVVAGGAALIGALLAWIGYWIILETANILFGLERSETLVRKGATVAFCFVFPLIWLTLTPQDLSEEIRTGANQEFTSRAVALLVAYILIPVTVVLSGLLAAYVVKTLVQGTFLTSRLGFTAAIYAAGIVFVALLAWPQREESGYVGLFWRAFPYLLIAPIMLLVPALWVRIAEYGWTPVRYLAVLTAIWVVIVAVCFMLPRWGGDLRIITGSAALLLAITAYGPWGVADVSARSQFARLEALMIQKGWLVDGRWARPNGTGLRYPESSTVRGALEALDVADQFHRLRPWFAGQQDDPFAEPKDRRRQRIYALLDATSSASLFPANSSVTFNVPTPYMISVGGRATVAGPISFYRSPPDVDDTPLGRLSVSFEDGLLKVADESGRKREIDCAAELTAATQDGGTAKQARIADGTGDLPVKFAIVNLSGVHSADKLVPTGGTAFLLIEQP